MVAAYCSPFSQRWPYPQGRAGIIRGIRVAPALRYNCRGSTAASFSKLGIPAGPRDIIRQNPSWFDKNKYIKKTWVRAGYFAAAVRGFLLPQSELLRLESARPLPTRRQRSTRFDKIRHVGCVTIFRRACSSVLGLSFMAENRVILMHKYSPYTFCATQTGKSPFYVTKIHSRKWKFGAVLPSEAPNTSFLMGKKVSAVERPAGRGRSTAHFYSEHLIFCYTILF